MSLPHQVQVILMALGPCVAALLCRLLNAMAGRPYGRVLVPRLRDIQNGVTIGTSFLSLILSLSLVNSLLSGQRLLFEVGGLRIYALDALSLYFALLVNLIALVASLYTGRYLDFELGAHPQVLARTARFYLLFNLFHFTMLLVPLVDNLVLLWIAVELTTFASTILVGYRRDRQALEAAWKYIIITSTGIIFALLGTIFLARAIPSGDLAINWSVLVERASVLDRNFVRLSFLFVLVGYGTKAGIAPMHTWLPDGHGEAPFPVSALLSGVLLKCAVYAILRFYTITNMTLGDTTFTSTLLLGAGLFSLVLATPFILKQNRFKRVLAYHSLEHIGIIVFGLGIGGSIALFGALLHVLNHALVKTLMFLGFGNVQINYRAVMQHQREECYVGVLRSMPGTGAMLAIGGLALVGAPPFSIFFSELLILWGALARATQPAGLWIGAAIGLFLISVTLIFGGLVRHLSHMLLADPPPGVVPETARQVWPLGLLAVLMLLVGLMVLRLGPLDLSRLLAQSVEVVQGGRR